MQLVMLGLVMVDTFVWTHPTETKSLNITYIVIGDLGEQGMVIILGLYSHTKIQIIA